jgi:predicted acylesterase/phospholipase RssA
MADLEERILISDKRRNAFVASGGGMKAHFFHMGVGKRLQEAGFNFKGGVLEERHFEFRPLGEPGNKDLDLYVGSSGGALFSIGVALGYSPNQLYNLFMDDQQLSRAGLKRGVINYMDLNTRAVTELFKGLNRMLRNGFNPEGLIFLMSPLKLSPLEKMLHGFLRTDDFARVRSDLFVVTTPLNYPGRIVYCRKQSEDSNGVVYRNDARISAAVAGSCSLQFLNPYRILHDNGDKIDVVDGETRNTLSYQIAADNGADLVFVSYTHVPYQFHPGYGSLKKYGMVRVALQSIYLVIEEKIQSAQKVNLDQNFVCDSVEEAFERLKQDIPGSSSILDRNKEDLMRRLTEHLGIRRDVDFIFIAPDKEDREFFFDWHLGMSKDYIQRIAQKGYDAADKALKRYRFI